MNNITAPMSLSDRFPHLQYEIRVLTEKDSNFRHLSDDYCLLLRSLEMIEPDAEDDRVEMISLKTSLEAEALEMLSQVKTRR